MIVSYEVDACIATEHTVGGLHSDTGHTPCPRPPLPSSDGSPPSPPPASPTRPSSLRSNPTKLKVIRGGHQSSLIELKSSPHLLWTDAYPQLFFGQIPHLYQGRHVDGWFARVSEWAREERAARYDAVLAARFRGVRDALRAIQEVVLQHGRRSRLSLVYETHKGRRLEVYRRKGLLVVGCPRRLCGASRRARCDEVRAGCLRSISGSQWRIRSHSLCEIEFYLIGWVRRSLMNARMSD